MKIIFLLTLIIFYKQLLGQNLVPNPSFEYINYCTELKQPCSPAGWFYINQRPRGYHGRSTFSSADGTRHLNLLMVDTGSASRDYWQTRLLCPLEAGEKYRVKFMVTSQSKTFNVRDLGFHFSNGLILTTKDTIFNPDEYLSFTEATIKKKKRGWYEIQIDLTPAKNFTHLIIGNFSKESNQQLGREKKMTSRWSSIAIDDISISPKNKVQCKYSAAVLDSLYAIRSRHSAIDNLPLDTPSFKPGNDTIVINSIEFGFDSSVIQNEDSLEYLKPYLMDTSIKLLRIVGFTDNNGSLSYNMALSLSRAQAVSKYLREKLDIVVPMEVEGLGISEKYNEPQRNRRVEIWVYR